MNIPKFKFWQAKVNEGTLDALPTIVNVLQYRAKLQGDKVAFIYLKDGETETASITYRELNKEAQRVAASLQARGLNGKQVLLLYPSGIEFIKAFVGCLYAGAIAVPATAPRNKRALGRLRSIIEDATPQLVLTSTSVLNNIQVDIIGTDLGSIKCITLDILTQNETQKWQPMPLTGRSLAFIQYTSGSTADPKGVMIDHSNLLANNRMIRNAFNSPENNVFVSWLPMFHDMGLLGNMLQIIYTGAKCIFMPPEAFLMKPLRWLQAIEKYQAITSGGPNFAYDLCLRRISDAQLSKLNLDSWKIAYVGAEPVRAATMSKFEERFAPTRLKKSTLYPCYGMAEACLFISGNKSGSGAIREYFNTVALSNGIATLTHETNDSHSRTLVSCGHGWLGLEIKIVDPSTCSLLPNSRVGEIWVSGDNIVQGYWNNPEATENTFNATIQGNPKQRYLRTGDLGFIHKGSLYISGRLKDLIIVAGRNHHPVDIEHTTEQCHEVIRPGGTAVFSVDMEDRENLIVATELERTARNIDIQAIEKTIRSAISIEHDLMVHDIVFLKPATCPKTSSGKVMRHACKLAWQQHKLTLWGKTK